MGSVTGLYAHLIAFPMLTSSVSAPQSSRSVNAILRMWRPK